MSKASQRRLAATQKREKEVFKKLPPFEQVIKMLPKLLMSSSGKALWRSLCQQVTPDPPHDDRARLIKWLRIIAHDHMPIFEAARACGKEIIFEVGSDGDGGSSSPLSRSIEAALQFGGRLFIGNDSSIYTHMEWIEPTEFVIRSDDGKPPSNQISTALNLVLDDLIADGHTPDCLAIAFVAPTADLAVCIAGITDTGAFAAAIVIDEEVLIANSFALAETMFCIATMPFQALEDAAPAQVLNLTELRGILQNTTESALLDPNSQARQYYSEMVRGLMQPLMDAQSYMAFRQRYLSDELSAVNFVSATAVKQAKSAAKGTAEVSWEKQLHEKRLAALQDQVNHLQTQLALQRPPPEAHASTSIPSSASLEQRLGCFFGH